MLFKHWIIAMVVRKLTSLFSRVSPAFPYSFDWTARPNSKRCRTRLALWHASKTESGSFPCILHSRIWAVLGSSASHPSTKLLAVAACPPPSDRFSLELFNPSKLQRPNPRLGITSHGGWGFSNRWEAREGREEGAHLSFADVAEVVPPTPRWPHRCPKSHGHIPDRTRGWLHPAIPSWPAPCKAGSAAARTPGAGARICRTSWWGSFCEAQSWQDWASLLS